MATTTQPPLFVGEGKSPLALALARCRKKSRVSSDHRPPTSHARTTRQDLAYWPDSSGYRLSFRALAVSNEAHPLSCSAVEEGHHPFAEETPWWCRWPAASRPRPPPNVSCLGGLGEGGPCRASSRWWTPWRLLLCTPLQRLIQERTPNDPTPQPARKLHEDGHEIKWKATRQLWEEGSKGSQRRRSSNTMNDEESILTPST